MKIKTKKRMTPEEHAKYMIDKHGISSLKSELIGDNIIDAPKRYVLTFELNPVSMKEMSDTGFENKEFTIEIEEDITEDTHLDYLYALTNDDEKEIRRCMNFTIRTASMVIGRSDLTFFTLIDNDLVKIYENGKLVE